MIGACRAYMLCIFLERPRRGLRLFKEKALLAFVRTRRWLRGPLFRHAVCDHREPRAFDCSAVCACVCIVCPWVAMAAFAKFWFEIELASGGGVAVASPVRLAAPGQPAAPWGAWVPPWGEASIAAPRHIDILDAAIGSTQDPLRGHVPRRQDWVDSWADSSSGQIWRPPSSGGQQFCEDWQSLWPSSSDGQPAATGENQVASQPAATGEVSWLPWSNWLSSRRPPYAKVKVVEQTNEDDRVRMSCVNWWEVPCRDGASCANQCECPSSMTRRHTRARSCPCIGTMSPELSQTEATPATFISAVHFENALVVLKFEHSAGRNLHR